MKIAIVNSPNPQSIAIKEQILTFGRAHDLTFDQDQPNLVLSIGGDGTLLNAFHQYESMLDQVRFVGIHTGHLGFYTDWRDDELDLFFDALLQDAGERVSYPLLELKLFHWDGQVTRKLALNEATIRRYEGTMTCDVSIKEDLFELFKGDGLCVATPTGSTGLNKSLGGVVVHPRLDTLQLTEIASINNRVYRTLSSSLLIASDEWIVITPDPAFKSNVMISIDQDTFPIGDVDRLQFAIAKERVHFARYRHMHFWNRVEQSFIGVKSKERGSHFDS
ncbi:NAD(+) kinase [Aerococcus urinaehominis]|uniref:NAD kinase n=1 Tax=Aerococcus urinaehominis TaxID=128944 RepID=A0A0X8FLP8_9LACT|nr:NAD kinase [Aerococcus urinaehominis]AMB99633.1 NAD(+) kinase [Aerococcus urinaehominis]SDL88194.1 NAD+ kinase [Aerococcus urinaehominis]